VKTNALVDYCSDKVKNNFKVVISRPAVFLVAVVWASLPWHADAQNYPSKLVRIVLPFAPGGSSDLVAHVVAQQMSAITGQSVVVDNRPGASGNIGFELVARAAPDGYTVLMGSIPLIVNPSLYPKVPYDPIRDFAPVSLVAASPFVLFTHPSVPARSVKELIVLATKQPGKLNYSAGVGTNGYMAVELLKYLTHTDIINIPYKGGGQTLMAVVSGETHLSMLSIDTVLPNVRAGKLRALGISSNKRSSALPQSPTIAEAGVPGYEYSAWAGALLPGGASPATVNELHSLIAKAMRGPAVTQSLAEGTDIIVSTPAQFASHIRIEIETWSKVVKVMGLRAE
jgi:tripartite-type tricarboxylate transporter receptor subunit TctC